MMNSERRIRNNRIRRQRQLRRNILMLCFTLVLIVTLSIGGFALGAIFTRSRLAFSANLRASFADITPTCSPSAEITLTSLSLISSLIWVASLLIPKHLLKNLA